VGWRDGLEPTVMQGGFLPQLREVSDGHGQILPGIRSVTS